MRGLPLNRLHDTARREMGWDAQQQVDMVGPHVSFENLDVLTPADFPDQIFAPGTTTTESPPVWSGNVRTWISPEPRYRSTASS